MRKQNNQLRTELNALHSGVMAIESLLVSKGIISVRELNSAIERAARACLSAQRDGRVIVQKRLGPCKLGRKKRRPVAR